MTDIRSKGIKLIRLNPGTAVSGDHSIAYPHRDDHYMLVVIEEGTVSGNIDFEEIEANGPFLLLVFPGQVHLLSPTTQMAGWIIDFDSSVIDLDLRKELESRCEDVLALQLQPALQPFLHIKELLVIMQELYQQPFSTKYEAIAAILKAVLHITSGLALQT